MPIDDSRILDEHVFDHPQYDFGTIAAQAVFLSIQGRPDTRSAPSRLCSAPRLRYERKFQDLGQTACLRDRKCVSYPALSPSTDFKEHEPEGTGEKSGYTTTQGAKRK